MSRNILVSIYPKYLKDIHSGIKNFEFRPYKINTKDEFFNMWVYETKPVMEINTLLKIRHGVTKLEDSLTKEYFLGNDKFHKNIDSNNFAYEIVGVRKIKPMPLSRAKQLGIYNAPQSIIDLKKYPELLRELKICDLEVNKGDEF